MVSHRTIIKRGNRIYLYVGDRWYYYDESSQPIGSGAMGVVYLGYSCEGNDRVAIKRVIDRYANIPSIRERARLEASLMFRHHNLVEMLGYCELQSSTGPIFIVSRYVQGVNIDRYVESIPRTLLRVQKICRMLYPVLDALDYIHSKGIVHMDIKPSNIMVENSCNIRLMDLGIASVDDHIIAGESTSVALMGTPKYAAPEQFGNKNYKGALDSSTDIFEFGITLYELLSGSNPFEARNINEALKKRKTTVLPYSKGIPRKVVDVLRKATAFEQSKRYKTAGELKIALEHALRKKSKPVIPVMLAVSIGIFIISFIIVLLTILFLL